MVAVVPATKVPATPVTVNSVTLRTLPSTSVSLVMTLPLIGVLNVGVSFYMAFRVALQAHSVTSDGRATILRAIGLRLRRRPGSFFWPQRQEF
jgi:site-specific recombinase